MEGNERGWKGMKDNKMNVKKITKLNRIKGNKKGLKGMKEEGRGKNEGRNKRWWIWLKSKEIEQSDTYETYRYMQIIK